MQFAVGERVRIFSYSCFGKCNFGYGFWLYGWFRHGFTYPYT